MIWIWPALLFDGAAVMEAFDGNRRLALFMAVCSVSCWLCAWQERTSTHGSP